MDMKAILGGLTGILVCATGISVMADIVQDAKDAEAECECELVEDFII